MHKKPKFIRREKFTFGFHRIRMSTIDHIVLQTPSGASGIQIFTICRETYFIAGSLGQTHPMNLVVVKKCLPVPNGHIPEL